VRVTTAFSRLLRLPGVWVRHVAFEPDRVVVTVALRRRRLVCPECGFSTVGRYDRRPVPSVWRHLDLGAWRLEIRAELRRLVCPTHGVRREAVPFAQPGSYHTHDFEDLVGWLATTMDKTAVCRLVRIDWDTVGRIITRVMDDGLDPDRLEDLFDIGVDEVSWTKRHNYLTLVSDHRRAKIVWGHEGRDTATLDGFFTELGTKRAERIEAVSMDMSAGYAKSVAKPGHASNAVICYDPFHVVALGTKALDVVRREVWNDRLEHAGRLYCQSPVDSRQTLNQALFDGHYLDVDADGTTLVATLSLKPEFEALIGFTQELRDRVECHEQHTDQARALLADVWSHHLASTAQRQATPPSRPTLSLAERPG